MNYLGIDWGQFGKLQISSDVLEDIDYFASFWTGEIYHFKQKENISTSKKFNEIIKKHETEKVLIMIDSYSDYNDIEYKLSKKAKCEFVVLRRSLLKHPYYFLDGPQQKINRKFCTEVSNGFILISDEITSNKVSIDLLKINLLFPN